MGCTHSANDKQAKDRSRQIDEQVWYFSSLCPRIKSWAYLAE